MGHRQAGFSNPGRGGRPGSGGVAVSPDGTDAYIANRVNGTVSVIFPVAVPLEQLIRSDR